MDGLKEEIEKNQKKLKMEVQFLLWIMLFQQLPLVDQLVVKLKL